MPTVSRKRTVPANPDRVYDLVSDPSRLSEWWPRVIRVEDVAGKAGAERTRWTSVLEADSGRMLRLDYRCTGATRPQRYEWEHELDGTPYQSHLVRQAVEVRITPKGEGSEVSLTTVNALRGTAKIAGFSMKRGQRELLDEALEGLAGNFSSAADTDGEGAG
ncbi:MAG: SRPBCC family protein [Solirubrobacterales bacterium]|nr:SRPBCC family protein [Solirubrobacterales bacterium]MCB0862871.1 SRPBCC family protein [Solirubrobacterales bacterium]MCB8915229.1 SRPBCC family protein [Thermoleophilales bacterium]